MAVLSRFVVCEDIFAAALTLAKLCESGNGIEFMMRMRTCTSLKLVCWQVSTDVLTNVRLEVFDPLRDAGSSAGLSVG